MNTLGGWGLWPMIVLGVDFLLLLLHTCMFVVVVACMFFGLLLLLCACVLLLGLCVCGVSFFVS